MNTGRRLSITSLKDTPVVVKGNTPQNVIQVATKMSQNIFLLTTIPLLICNLFLLNSLKLIVTVFVKQEKHLLLRQVRTLNL